MLEKETIEKMKKEVFNHISTCLERPSLQDYYPYKRRIAGNYNYLKREKDKVLKDKKVKDEYSLVKYFKDIDSILSISDENKKIYSNISSLELTDILINSEKESKKVISKIKRVSKKETVTKEELTKKSHELKRLSAIAKLYERRLTFLKNYIDIENKKTR